MNPIKFECPHCHEIIAGDESLYGQRVQVDLVGVSSPSKVKEMIRTQYRAARHREGVRPTEFMQSP